MKLELHSRAVRMTRELRGYIERKLELAFGRFLPRVQRVRVCVTDVNGPKGGGDDIQCLIQAKLHSSGELQTREVRGDPFAAVARASEQIRRRTARHFERKQMRRKARSR